MQAGRGRKESTYELPLILLPGLGSHPLRDSYLPHPTLLPPVSSSAPLPPQCRSWLLRAQAVPNRAPRSRASQPQPFIFDAKGLLHLRLKHRCEKPTPFPCRPGPPPPPLPSAHPKPTKASVWSGSAFQEAAWTQSGSSVPAPDVPEARGQRGERAWDSGLSPRYYVDR